MIDWTRILIVVGIAFASATVMSYFFNYLCLSIYERLYKESFLTFMETHKEEIIKGILDVAREKLEVVAEEEDDDDDFPEDFHSR